MQDINVRNHRVYSTQIVIDILIELTIDFIFNFAW